MTRPIDDHWMDHDDCREPERAVIKVTAPAEHEDTIKEIAGKMTRVHIEKKEAGNAED